MPVTTHQPDQISNPAASRSGSGRGSISNEAHASGCPERRRGQGRTEWLAVVCNTCGKTFTGPKASEAMGGHMTANRGCSENGWRSFQASDSEADSGCAPYFAKEAASNLRTETDKAPENRTPCGDALHCGGGSRGGAARTRFQIAPGFVCNACGQTYMGPLAWMTVGGHIAASSTCREAGKGCSPLVASTATSCVPTDAPNGCCDLEPALTHAQQLSLTDEAVGHERFGEGGGDGDGRSPQMPGVVAMDAFPLSGDLDSGMPHFPGFTGQIVGAVWGEGEDVMMGTAAHHDGEDGERNSWEGESAGERCWIGGDDWNCGDGVGEGEGEGDGEPAWRGGEGDGNNGENCDGSSGTNGLSTNPFVDSGPPYLREFDSCPPLLLGRFQFPNTNDVSAGEDDVGAGADNVGAGADDVGADDVGAGADDVRAGAEESGDRESNAAAVAAFGGADGAATAAESDDGEEEDQIESDGSQSDCSSDSEGEGNSNDGDGHGAHMNIGGCEDSEGVSDDSEDGSSSSAGEDEDVILCGVTRVDDPVAVIDIVDDDSDRGGDNHGNRVQSGGGHRSRRGRGRGRRCRPERAVAVSATPVRRRGQPVGVRVTMVCSFCGRGGFSGAVGLKNHQLRSPVNRRLLRNTRPSPC